MEIVLSLVWVGLQYLLGLTAFLAVLSWILFFRNDVVIYGKESGKPTKFGEIKIIARTHWNSDFEPEKVYKGENSEEDDAAKMPDKKSSKTENKSRSAGSEADTDAEAGLKLEFSPLAKPLLHNFWVLPLAIALLPFTGLVFTAIIAIVLNILVLMGKEKRHNTRMFIVERSPIGYPYDEEENARYLSFRNSFGEKVDDWYMIKSVPLSNVDILLQLGLIVFYAFSCYAVANGVYGMRVFHVVLGSIVFVFADLILNAFEDSRGNRVDVILASIVLAGISILLLGSAQTMNREGTSLLIDLGSNGLVIFADWFIVGYFFKSYIVKAITMKVISSGGTSKLVTGTFRMFRGSDSDKDGKSDDQQGSPTLSPAPAAGD